MFDKIRAALEDVILGLNIGHEKYGGTHEHEALLNSAEEALKTNARMREAFCKRKGSVGGDIVRSLARYLEGLQLAASHESHQPYPSIHFPVAVVKWLSKSAAQVRREEIEGFLLIAACVLVMVIILAAVVGVFYLMYIAVNERNLPALLAAWVGAVLLLYVFGYFLRA